MFIKIVCKAFGFCEHIILMALATLCNASDEEDEVGCIWGISGGKLAGIPLYKNSIAKFVSPLAAFIAASASDLTKPISTKLLICSV